MLPSRSINDRAGHRGHILQGGVQQRCDLQNKQVLDKTIRLCLSLSLKLLTFSPSSPPFVTSLIPQALFYLGGCPSLDAHESSWHRRPDNWRLAKPWHKHEMPLTRDSRTKLKHSPNATWHLFKWCCFNYIFLQRRHESPAYQREAISAAAALCGS